MAGRGGGRLGGGGGGSKTKLLSCKQRATPCPLGLDLTLPITSGCRNNEGEAGAGRDGAHVLTATSVFPRDKLVVGHWRGAEGRG